MTSQHFGADEAKEEWCEWDEWGDSNNNNNNRSQIQKSQQSGQQTHQHPQQIASNVPLYSPFAYQQIPQQHQQQQQLPQPQQQILQPQHQQQFPQHMPPSHQQTFGNQNVFNPSNFNDNTNNNRMQYPVTAHQSSAIPHASHVPPVSTSSDTFYEKNSRSDGLAEMKKDFSPNNSVMHPVSLPSMESNVAKFMPSPSTSPMQLPPPPQLERTADDDYTSNQQKNLPAPPIMPSFEAMQNMEMPARGPSDYQPQGWSSNVSSHDAPFPINPMQQSWNPTQSNFSQVQYQPTLSQNQMANHVDNPSASDPFSAGHLMTPSDHLQIHQKPESSFVNGNDVSFFGAVEAPLTNHFVELPTVEPIATPNANVDTFCPENREHLDDISAPPTTSLSSFTDRHNYLVTGQLSQERPTVPYQHQHQHQHHQQQVNVNHGEKLPPPGLSRLVVGQPEHNSDQVPVPDIVPPGLNRMVTGTEMNSSNYMNYQRQADGEVSQPSNIVLRPQSNSPFNHNHNHHHQNSSENAQQSFNTTDRNLYLVAGESDAYNQRVIPGVESEASAASGIVHPMQNLHIQDDGGFANASVSTQERNVNVDGMEIVLDTSQQRPIDVEPREEVIDGANDNSESFTTSTMPSHDNVIVGAVSLEPESDVREEAIEGANDYNDDVSKAIENLKQKIDMKKQEMSSEDSELRELARNKSKTASRRSKKYADDSIESENESDADRKERMNEKRRPPREAMTREEYDKYRKREKDRRPRPKRGDDTDGSKYGDSRRRTDDEEEFRKSEKYKRSSRGKHPEDEELDERERKKREKYRDSGSKRNYDDDRRERRRRERYYEEDAYNGRRSQNASDREYQGDRYNRRSREHAEKDRKYDPNYYQQYPGYETTNFNYNSYYQQQQYYDTLRRTNPQAYYEWYTKYIAMMQQAQVHQQQPATVEGSMRSGYSSSNEKDRTSSNRFLAGGDISNPLRSMNSSFIDNTDYQSLQGFASGKDLAQTYGSLNYNQKFSYDGYSRDKSGDVSSEVQRSTPRKFQALHSFVRLSNGLITTVDSQNGYMVKIENISVSDKTRRLYQSYPGPLVRGVTHKKTVIEFCEDKLKQDQQIVQSHRTSYSLLWSYLILMLRQNGNYTETDISELLMKNSEDSKGHVESGSIDDTKNTTVEDATDVSDNEENATSEKNSNSQSNSVTQSLEEETSSGVAGKSILPKFRDYLLYGNINDALEFATENNLWGHALFLASKVDRRHHANVMLKFANKLPYNDPLQTLYQIMSGRMPSCVTNLDDKWGDWRPHLAMIISNCTDKPELVKRSIMALGDSLATRGDIYASQFCYLLVEPLFKDFNDETSSSKIVLLGASHLGDFKDLASDDAIIMSEIYEYARTLSEENFFIPSLQKYKFLLGGKMLDYGMQLKCLLYIEQIAKCIVLKPTTFDGNFVAKVYALGDQLKYYDPVMEKSYEDNYNNNEYTQTEDQKWLQDLSVLVNHNVGSPVSNHQPVEEYVQEHPVANDVYNPLSYAPSSVPSGIYDPMSQLQTPVHVTGNYEPDMSYQANQEQAQAESYNQYQNDQQEQTYPNDYNSQSLHDSHQQFNEQPAYDPNAHMNYQQPITAQQDYGYGYDQQNSYQPPSQPKITMGNTSNNFNDLSGQNDDGGDKKKSPVKKMEDKSKKPVLQEGGHAGGGWFGGIFSKLSIKPKNQMILPDDKNPTIVWDEATKTWVNKDGDAAEVESFKPPPKMGDMGITPQQLPMPMQQPNLMQQHGSQMNQLPPTQMRQTTQQVSNQNMDDGHQLIQNQSQQVNLTADAAVAQPPSANMFKMQKGRNLKKSYVDILGNSGQTVSQPKDLAPQMDMQFFNPVQQQGMQFYNPNDFQ